MIIRGPFLSSLMLLTLIQGVCAEIFKRYQFNGVTIGTDYSLFYLDINDKRLNSI